MATTTNYGWDTPDDTDLVKDGAAAIRTLGSSVDTTTKALNPSTTLGDIEYRSSTANTNTRLAIGTTGQVLSVAAGVPTWTTPSASGFVGVKVFKSATQSLSNATFTVSTFDSESFDTDGFHDNSVDNSRLTVPAGKAGKYLVYFATTFQSNNVGQRQVQIILNAGGGTTFVTIGVSSYLGQTQGTTVLDLAVADFIELNCYQDSGGPLNINGTANATYFGMNYLGA